MRSNIVVFWVIAGFFALIGTVYTVWHLIAYPELPVNEAIEWVGTVGLYFTALMAIMVAFYLGRVRSAQGGELPEDTLTADIDDGDPEIGEFAPWSWWPIVLAGSAAVFAIGLAVGQFMLPIGLAIFVVAIVGWTYEYYRGYFAR
ncbi:cytochrome c oxidase subunit 4 [Microbacterium sp. YY-01]|uniref:cytochrome c oxidase subunit 4 n=1 Tax=Microbacterium sp. YY-01 TaxID=3421634 RepID=UPI003D1826D6